MSTWIDKQIHCTFIYMCFFIHRLVKVYMTWYISFLKTRVLLSVVWQTIFLFLINCRNVSIWECPAFLPLVVWLHSFITAFPLLMSSWDRRALTTPQSWPQSFFHGAAELGPQVRSATSVLQHQTLTPVRSQNSCWQGVQSHPITCVTKGRASQWRALPRASSSSEQKHAGVSAQGSVPPSFHTAWSG